MTFLEQGVGTLVPRGTLKLLVHRKQTASLVILLSLCLWSLSRGFHFPLAYASAQWMLNYNHGFIKRGMVGTLLWPLYYFKSPNEILELIHAMSIAVLIAWALVLLACAHFAIKAVSARRGVVVFPLILFFSSSFIAQAAFCIGYFDRFLDLFTLLSVAAVLRRRFFALPFIAMFGLSVHELFILYGFPVVCFALLLQLGEMLRRRQLRIARALFILTLTTVPTLLFYLSILLAQTGLSDAVLEAVKNDILALGVYHPSDKWWIMFHLKNDLAANFHAQGDHAFVRRILNARIVAEVLPTTLFITGITALLLARLRRARFIPVLVLVVAVPLLIHLVAWDTHRFWNFTVFHAFACLFSAATILKPRLHAGRVVSLAMGIVFVAILLVNLVGEVSLTDKITEERSLFAHRKTPARDVFAGKPRLFPNSDFDMRTLVNWTATGDILRKTQPKNAAFRSLGRGWYGTYDLTRDVRNGGGDMPRGELLSVPFTIEHDTILFLLSGGKSRNLTYVALEVDGKEVMRESGLNKPAFAPKAWDVSAFRGKEARIRLVDRDQGPWGHMNIDAFCYWP